MDKPCCVGVVRNAKGLTGKEIVVSTEKADLPMYVNKPPNGGNGIGVLVIHDIFGFELPNCKYIVDSLVSQGFTAVLPNFYVETGAWPATETDIEKPLEGEEFGAWFGSIMDETFWAGHFSRCVVASAAYLKAQGCAKLTTLGFCWGGKAVTVACQTDLFSAGVSLHGAAHSVADVTGSKCPLFFVAIQGDPFFPETVHEEIRALGIEVKIYEGMYHGFVVRGDYENNTAVKAGAEEALTDTLVFFKNNCTDIASTSSEVVVQLSLSWEEGDFVPASEQELKDIQILKERVEANKPENRDDLTDIMYLRFWRGRKHVFEDAERSLLRHLQWRAENDVRNFESFECSTEIASRKCWVEGVDKKKHPIVWVFARRHDKKKRDIDEMKRFIIQNLCKALKMSVPTEEQMIIVFDLSKFGMSCMDYEVVKLLIAILAHNFPDTLHKVHIVNHPWIFNACWTIIKAWLDPVTALKVNFTSAEELTKYIEKDYIPKDLGDVKS